MKVFECDQRSEEWFKLRLGKVTGTRLKSLMGKEWRGVIDELVAEIITQTSEESYVDSKMQWGIDNEPIAKYEYEKTVFSKVFEVGFCISDTYPILGLSPDGWVGASGAVEIKCPTSKTHIKYIREDVLPSNYLWQVVNYFLVNDDLEWLDFVSFDPRNKIYPLWIKRILREDMEENIKKAVDVVEIASIELKKQLNNIGYKTEF